MKPCALNGQNFFPSLLNIYFHNFTQLGWLKMQIRKSRIVQATFVM